MADVKNSTSGFERNSRDRRRDKSQDAQHGERNREADSRDR